jgi:2-keto-4-pentenoate hydratase/2-oxohepta-3-ene-1,7-dioic acid hydratase in catechol pathway
MRLATIQTPAGPTAALYRDGHYIELPGQSVRGLLSRDSFAGLTEGQRHPAEAVKLLPPVPDAPKVLCIGLNYRDHAIETGAAIPREPVVFNKFPTALIAHGEPIVLPPVSEKVDYEAELVLVIGKGGRHIPRSEAMRHIAGATVGHDVSARDWQRKDGDQWLLGKTFDTFGPTGPHLVTLDEIGDLHDLRIQLRINGQTLQDSRTNQLIFQADTLIEYISKVVTLQPGDLIFTGTPPGVGVARKPPVWLKAGDEVEVEIEKLGILRNPVVAG